MKVGLIGFGTVGTGVVKLLLNRKELIYKRTGIDLELKKIADLDITRPRDVQVPTELLTTSAEEIIRDPEIEIVIELIGGIEPARSYILEAIENGKWIVTANKALLAEKGEEIFKKAQEKGVEIGFEASVGGGIPIIRAIKEGLVGNNFKKIKGIVNGTTNYILTKMEKLNIDFQDALSEAINEGFAEADPSLDIEGDDAAHKASILAMLAFNTLIPFDKVYKEGITEVTLKDIEYAKALGYKIKLLAIAKEDNGKVEVRVHPTMIPLNDMLASVEYEFNAITVEGDFTGPVLLYGRGAGQLPTSVAVLSDIVSLAKAKLLGHKGTAQSLETKQIKPIDEIECRYYLRLIAVDKPGVLAKIAGILGNEGISIASVIQMERWEEGDEVPVIMMTHTAREASMQKALREIEKLDVIRGKPFIIRVEEG